MLVRTERRSDDSGSTLLTVLIVVLVLGMLAVSLSAAVTATTRSTVGVRGSLQSQAAADAGLAAAVAAAKSGDVCRVTVPPGTLATGSYTASVTCDVSRTTATVTATGTSAGTSTRVQAVYSLVPETQELVDPGHTPVGLVLYEGSTMGQVTLLAHGTNEPQVVSVKGPFGCRLGIPGNLIVGGNVTSTDGCHVTGDVYAAGTVDFSGGETTVRGDILAAGSGVTKLNSLIGDQTPGAPLSTIRVNGALDLLWPTTRVRAHITARGPVTVNGRTVEGGVTLPDGLTPTVSSTGRILGPVVNSADISPLPAPALPQWFDYAYRASDWPGATVVTLRNPKGRTTATDTCEYYNEWTSFPVGGSTGGGNRGWSDLANYTGTVVIDARACTELTSNAGGHPSPALRAANVVLLAKRFNTTALTMTSAPGASPKVFFLTEDTVADRAPTCPAGPTASNFSTNGANLDGVRSLIYTPCRLAMNGGGVLLGSIYTNGFDSGGQLTLKGELMSLPGMLPPDGGYGGTPIVVPTGDFTLGELLSRRDVGLP